MSTASLIAKKINAAEYRTIYCHFDGYPKYMLKLLSEHYASEERVDELLDLGDASSLTAKLYPHPGYPHSFENPQEAISVFYGRDRGETDREASICSLADLKKSSVDFVYIYDDEWKVLWR